MLGEGSETERSREGGNWGFRGGNWEPRGREVGEKGEGSGGWVPPVHPHNFSVMLRFILAISTCVFSHS